MTRRMHRAHLAALWVAVLALPFPSVAQARQTQPGPAASRVLTLSDALDSAFATHPALASADARAQGAGEAARAARGRRLPALGLQMSLTRFKEPMITTPIHAFNPALLPDFDETLVQGQLGARYTLWDWGDRSSAITAADLEASAAGASHRSARSDLIVEVTTAYLRVHATRAVHEAAQARISALEAELDRARRALEEGTAAEVEVLRAAVALQDAEANATTSAGAAVQAERALALLIGTSPERIAEAALDEMPLAVTAPAPGPSEDVEANPLVEQAGLRAEAAQARVGAQRAGRYPRLDLTGAVLDFGTLSDRHVFEWQAGVQLSWDLFSGGARTASIRRAEAEALAAQGAAAALALEVRTAVDAARTAVDAADARARALEGSVEQWEELVRIEGLALEAGSGTQRDLLEAQAGLFQARAGLVQARAEAVLARVRLEASRGTLDRNRMMEITGGAQ